VLTAGPEVSVCIPVYRGEAFLAETIRSVLSQTFEDFELVLLDNASTDETPHIARSFGDPRLRIATNATTILQPDNWRRAVELCRAPLVKLVCADDLLYPECLERQVAALAADPGLALVAARRDMIDESGRALFRGRGLKGLVGERSGVEVARRVVRSGANPIGEPGGVLFRRADYEAVGGWRPERQWAMDLDLWIRLLSRGRFLGQAETLAAFRVGGQSLSADNDVSIYGDQRAIVDQVSANPRLRVRPVDRAIGRLGAHSGRLRRLLLFALAARTSRRGPQAVPTGPPVSSCGS
jgi:glycosyltransferase involved in cell wall biosynthesis